MAFAPASLFILFPGAAAEIDAVRPAIPHNLLHIVAVLFGRFRIELIIACVLQAGKGKRHGAARTAANTFGSVYYDHFLFSSQEYLYNSICFQSFFLIDDYTPMR